MNNKKVIYSPLSHPKVLDKAEKLPSQILPETLATKPTTPRTQVHGGSPHTAAMCRTT